MRQPLNPSCLYCTNLVCFQIPDIFPKVSQADRYFTIGKSLIIKLKKTHHMVSISTLHSTFYLNITLLTNIVQNFIVVNFIAGSELEKPSICNVWHFKNILCYTAWNTEVVPLKILMFMFSHLEILKRNEKIITGRMKIAWKCCKYL